MAIKLEKYFPSFELVKRTDEQKNYERLASSLLAAFYKDTQNELRDRSTLGVHF